MGRAEQSTQSFSPFSLTTLWQHLLPSEVRCCNRTKRLISSKPAIIEICLVREIAFIGLC